MTRPLLQLPLERFIEEKRALEGEEEEEESEGTGRGEEQAGEETRGGGGEKVHRRSKVLTSLETSKMTQGFVRPQRIFTNQSIIEFPKTNQQSPTPTPTTTKRASTGQRAPVGNLHPLHTLSQRVSLFLMLIVRDLRRRQLECINWELLCGFTKWIRAHLNHLQKESPKCQSKKKEIKNKIKLSKL